MTYDEYISGILMQVSDTIRQYENPIQIIGQIASEHKSLVELPQQQQWVLGGILGQMLHKAYCDSRKLDKPNSDGLQNNPRLKTLNSEIDVPFVEAFKEALAINPEIASKTLYLDENGNVVMDIANTDFVDLSPFWQKDNFLAGCAAARSIISSWDGLMNENPIIREFVVVAVANGIHESWLARGNVSDYNNELNTAYVNLPLEEKEKDLEHIKMAKNLLKQLYDLMKEKKKSNNPDTPTNG